MNSSAGSSINRAAVLGLSLWVGVLVLLSHWMGQQAHHWLPVQASNAAPLVDGLFSFETAIGTFVFGGVLSVVGWVLLFNRAEKYDATDAVPIEGNTRLEVIWTAIPFVLVMAIAAYAMQVSHRLGVVGPMEHIHAHSPIEMQGGYAGDRLPSEQIEVIARQWSWEFRYPGSNVSTTELHLPIDQPVTFRLTSDDVLHGFYIPAFRLKQDLIPGSEISYRLTPTREGRYRLRDSQFSGGYFASNQTDVVVESEESYRSWLSAAAHLPLQPAANPADALYRRRLERGDRGWATVPPAPPPAVNVDADPTARHDA